VSRHVNDFLRERIITSATRWARFDLDQKHPAIGAASGIRRCHSQVGLLTVAFQSSRFCGPPPVERRCDRVLLSGMVGRCASPVPTTPNHLDRTAREPSGPVSYERWLVRKLTKKTRRQARQSSASRLAGLALPDQLTVQADGTHVEPPHRPATAIRVLHDHSGRLAQPTEVGRNYRKNGDLS
jgi:hypothetical protein